MAIQIIRRTLFGALLMLLAGIAHADDASLPDSMWRRWQTGALRADRLQHASLSMSAALGIGLVSEDAAIGFAGGAMLGVGKELIDMRSTRFDWGDLTADIIGAGLGALAASAALR